MEKFVICPSCSSKSLSAIKGNNEVEITCLNCGISFEPGEGIAVIKQSGVYIILGYIFGFMNLIAFPIIFFPLSIICGLCCIVEGRWRILHGVIIIVLAVFIARYSAQVGGWGFGIPYGRFQI